MFSICNTQAYMVLPPLHRCILPALRKEFPVPHRFFSGEAWLLSHPVALEVCKLHFCMLSHWSRVQSAPKSGWRMSWTLQNLGDLWRNQDLPNGLLPG